jgi:sulfite dehydrogenase
MLLKQFACQSFDFRTMKKIFISFGFVFAVTFLAQSAPVTIQLPVETEVYRQAPGADLANAQCLTCHSADYAAIQPPMPTKFWKGEVDKMAAKYGAPIPANEVDALVKYFAKNYGTETSGEMPAPVIAKEKTIDAKQLMMKSGCFNCHNVQTKIIGPAYKDVAAKYRGNPDAVAKVSHQIRNGGSGLWGPFPMPPFKQLSDAQVKILADWILGQEIIAPKSPTGF